MNEDVLAAGSLNEAEALGGIEPLDCTFFFHNFLLKVPDGSVPEIRGRASKNKKRPRIRAAPVDNRDNPDTIFNCVPSIAQRKM